MFKTWIVFRKCNQIQRFPHLSFLLSSQNMQFYKKLGKESQWEILPWPPLHWIGMRLKTKASGTSISIAYWILLLYPQLGKNSYSGWYTTWMPWTNVPVPGANASLQNTSTDHATTSFALVNCFAGCKRKPQLHTSHKHTQIHCSSTWSIRFSVRLKTQ